MSEEDLPWPESIAYDRVLTPEEIQKVTQYLENKWNPAKLDGLKLWYDSTDPGALIKKDGKVVKFIDKSTRQGRARCWFRRNIRRVK